MVWFAALESLGKEGIAEETTWEGSKVKERFDEISLHKWWSLASTEEPTEDLMKNPGGISGKYSSLPCTVAAKYS
jgi:hypothetical protein